MKVGQRLTLTIDKPAAGGRMIARHEGAIVLVSGALPGEVVEAEIEKLQRGTAWARTAQVLESSPDRVAVEGDWACGGNVLAHATYPRQLIIKSQIIEDGFRRIGRLALPTEIAVSSSPTSGYRMRARLHVVNGRAGFFREGTHELCNPAATRQLLPETIEVLDRLPGALGDVMSALNEIELSENCLADERALHVVLRGDSDPSRLGAARPLPGVRGISCGASVGTRPLVWWGTPDVTDTVSVSHSAADTIRITLKRQAHSFFQGNRFLLTALVGAVLDQVPAGRVLDLYAGVGLFSVALAARGNDVVAVEGDRAAAHDLKYNALQVGGMLEARHQAVEPYLAGLTANLRAVLVDPPRTGMTKEALQGVLRLRPSRIVYVSCDIATLARDARGIVDHGYRFSHVEAFDLFPNTAHVECLAVFDN